MQNISISIDLVNKLLTFLGKQPFNQVVHLITEIEIEARKSMKQPEGETVVPNVMPEISKE